MGLQNSEGLVPLVTRVGIPLGKKKQKLNKKNSTTVKHQYEVCLFNTEFHKISMTQTLKRGRVNKIVISKST